MTWQESVMSDEVMLKEIWDLGVELEAEGKSPTQKDRFDRLVTAQAEIAYKDGQEDALKGALIEGGFESVKKLGRKEVVEYILFLEKNYSHTDWGNMQYRMDMRTKSKEWELLC